MTDPLAEAFIRGFASHNERLRKALAGLDGATLDRALGPETNSIAVLVAHATGSELGWLHLAAGRPFDRDRDSEFRTGGQSAGDLAVRIERTSSAIPGLVEAAVAGGIGAARRTRDGREVTAGYALVHALEHLAEHVGQVELTRQLVTRER